MFWQIYFGLHEFHVVRLVQGDLGRPTLEMFLMFHCFPSIYRMMGKCVSPGKIYLDENFGLAGIILLRSLSRDLRIRC